MTQPRKVVVVGQGYVGLPLAMRSVEVGHDVVGFDSDSAVVAALAQGHSHVGDVADEVLSEALKAGRYQPTGTDADLEGFDVALIAVPTPLLAGDPDTRSVEQAAETLGPFVTAGCLVVLESTTYPGTTEHLVGETLQRLSGLVPGVDFQLGYSPERIDPGNEQWPLAKIPKVVSGVNESSLAAVVEFYSGIVGEVVPTTGTREAEFAKLLENTYRFVNIALINELAISAQSMNVDIWEVIRAASSKPFGFTSFYPGPGVGGHCLPVDPSYLSWNIKQESGVGSKFIELATEVNDAMPSYVVSRLKAGLAKRDVGLEGAKVLVVGLSYKANSSDARESPAKPIVTELLESGAVVQVHDPLVRNFDQFRNIELAELSKAAVSTQDAVLVLVNHAIVDLIVVAEHASYVLDTRNCLAGPNVEVI